MVYDVSGTAGTVVGIAGMGIGLGLLAHTARGVTETMYGQGHRKGRRMPQRKMRPYRRRRSSLVIPVRPMYKWKY